MPSLTRSMLYAAIAVLIAGAVPASTAPVSSSNASPPTAEKPSQGKIPEGSGSSTEPLSEKLDRSGGVIHPPNGVDPGISQAPPAIGSHSTPVIPPPGSPGGKSGVNPK